MHDDIDTLNAIYANDPELRSALVDTVTQILMGDDKSVEIAMTPHKPMPNAGFVHLTSTIEYKSPSEDGSFRLTLVADEMDSAEVREGLCDILRRSVVGHAYTTMRVGSYQLARSIGIMPGPSYRLLEEYALDPAAEMRQESEREAAVLGATAKVELIKILLFPGGQVAMLRPTLTWANGTSTVLKEQPCELYPRENPLSRDAIIDFWNSVVSRTLVSED